MVVRLFSAHRDRDYVFLAILSFLAVLAASVLTVNSAFLIMFSLFLLTAVATFILLEIRRSCSSAKNQSRALNSGDMQRLGTSLVGMSPVLAVFILIIAAGIFFVLPRMSGGYLSAYAAAGELSTGFSDRVQLGRIGEIQQSNTVVMHVQIDGDGQGTHDLLWRGVALTIFDGRNWWGPRKQVVVPRWSDGRFVLPQSVPAQRLRPAAEGRIHYRVLLEPIGTNIFFLAPRPATLEGDYHMITVDDEGAVYDLDRDHPPGVYEAESDIGRPSEEQLRYSQANSSWQVSQEYVKLPAKLDGRIPELARQITGGAATTYDKAAAIERYLRSSYGYTLQLGRMAPKDPLAYFLFERKEGHCEYFASSMAVMLRTLQIPSRVVNGFRTGEFNDVTSQYVVRARNAHSWVEVYLPPYGWITFDPTPAAGLETRSGMGRAMLYLDAMASMWREWVVNYDFGHQRVLATDALRSTRNLGDAVREWARGHYVTLLNAARRIRFASRQSSRKWTGVVLLALLLLALLIKARAIVAFILQRRLANHPEKSPELAASIWYERMIRVLARRGWRKSPVHTPAEFVRTVSDPELQRSVGQFTDDYESARFGGSAEHARRLPEMYERILAETKR
jgi:protein-glutamine gamma-glutamyltransferase